MQPTSDAHVASLFDDDDADESRLQSNTSSALFNNDAVPTIKVNAQYAAKFEERKRKEELSWLRDKYGDSMNPERLRGINGADEEGDDDESDEESESSGVEEDELGEEMTPEMDLQLFRTIAAIRTKDKSVYEEKRSFFDDEELAKVREQARALKLDAAATAATNKKDKPVYLKDLHREAVLSGKLLGDDDGEDDTRRPQPTHQEEQEQLKRELKSALGVDTNAEAEPEDDNLFALRQKSNEERDDEDAGYKEWLLNSLQSEKSCQRAFKDWFDYQEQKRADLDENEKFLMGYIFNRGWMEKDVLPPSYKEIVGEDESDHSDGDAADSKTDGKADGNADKAASTGATASLDEDLSDIEAIEEAEQFERRYNFRFEELEATGAADPSTIAITTHSRTIPDSARRKDTRRAEQRQRRKEKKDSEKGRKDEELKRLKNLKKMEILERLKTIQKISGIKDDEKIAGLVEGVDLDEDFDPERWDAKMGSVFEEQYYGEDSAAVDALEKPKFDDDDEDDRLIAKLTGASATGKQGKKAKRNKAKKINLDAYAYEEVDEDDDFCMDADYMDGGEAALHHDDADVGVPVVNEDTSATTTTKKKGKKGKEDMKKTSFSDYLDEYFQLDYQDMIGDMPVRFKYRNVEADNFGLKPTEILSAQDKDLNEYLSIKKLAPFRNTDHDSQWLQRWRKGKKKRQAELRRKLAARERALKEGTSGSEFTWAQPLTGDAASDKKKKKKSKKVKSDNDTDVAAAEEKRDMKRKRVSEEGEDVDQKEATIARDDLNASAEAPIMATDAADATAQKPKKKKKKRPSAPVPSVSVPNDRLAVYAELNTSKEDKFKAKHEERMKKKKNVHRR